MKLLNAQAGSVMAVVLFLIFLTIFGLRQHFSDVYEEKAFSYEDDYANSLLLSFLRSTTESERIQCKQVRDIATKYIYGVLPGSYCCGIYDKTCSEFIVSTFDEKLDKIYSKFKKQYVLYFEIVVLGDEYESVVYKYGEESLKECKGDKVSAVQDLSAGEMEEVKGYARVIISRRDAGCLT